MIKYNEKHFSSSQLVQDIIIGMSDGLTVPFALAAGISGVTHSAAIIIAGGLAEIVAGSISMGLGGYLAAKSEIDHYKTELAREYQEVEEVPEVEAQEVTDIFKTYGLQDNEIVPIINSFRKDKKSWVEFMMKNELGLEETHPKQALKTAATITSAYVVGGFIPLLPYMFVSQNHQALLISAIMTLLALLIFGYVKGLFIGNRPFKSAFTTMITGGLAAGAAFLLASLISR
ncbi:MAG: VIT1/CCC1 transporter family protein [Candidatus Falkowbacteria bacterium]